MFFEGDPRLASDPWVKPALIIPLTAHVHPDGRFAWRGTFDMALAPEPNSV
jgi:hypothetical protein